jgi:hypothetical protein
MSEFTSAVGTFGHAAMPVLNPLSGVKRKSDFLAVRFAFDPNAADDFWAAREAERLTRLGDEHSSLARLDISLEAA